MADADDADTIHRIVEATKLAFGLRDATSPTRAS
jgi:gamma-glutamyltranspeptidase/glutathione hydrolase